VRVTQANPGEPSYVLGLRDTRAEAALNERLAPEPA
jgi:hypothetical protein